MFRTTLSGANKSDRLQVRETLIPKGARLVPGPAGGVVYTYERSGKLYAMAFCGSSARPSFHYSYRTPEHRDQRIADFHLALIAAAERKAKRSAEKTAWTNPAKVGDILYTSWGYDQTNVEFFAVTKVSGKRVWVREIAADFEGTGFMSGRTWPAMPIRFTGDESMHLAQMSNCHGGYSVTIDKVRTAWLESGRAHSTSSYA